MVAEVVNAGDIGVVAELSHGLGFASDPGTSRLIQLLGLDQVDGDVPVKFCVMGKKDLLLATLSQELLDLKAADGKGRWQGRRTSGGGDGGNTLG